MKNNLSTMLQAYGESDYYPLHMPGHKRRLFGNMPPDVLKMDITEIDGFDDLHHPENDGVLTEAQRRAEPVGDPFAQDAPGEEDAHEED